MFNFVTRLDACGRDEFLADLNKRAWARMAITLNHARDGRLAFDAAKFVLSHLEIDKPALKKMSVEDAKKYLLDFFRRRGVT